MHWLGYSLNTLTLLALAVIVGILVDDAIVEVENIERHARMDKPIKQAAGDAVTEIALAVMATTMTLVVVFLPTAMMSGVSGRFFKQFGWTCVIALLSSLLVARVLTPMMAAYLLKTHPGQVHEKDGVLMTRYIGWVRWCLSHRGWTLTGAAVVFAASFALVPLLETGLMPPSDKGSTSINVELPPGSSLATTLAATEAAASAIAGIEGIEHVMSTVGSAEAAGAGATQAGEVRRATMTLVLAPRGERPSQTAIENQVSAALLAVPGARFSLGGGIGAKMALLLASDDKAALKATAQALERELRDVPGLSNISSTASLERPEIVVRPDAQRAAEQGVSTATIGETVRIATNGDFDAQMAKLNLDNRQVAIQVRMPDEARQDLETVSNLRVHGKNGLIPLSSVAKVAVESGPSQIDRYDRRRYVTVSADLGGTPLGQALEAAKALPAIQAMPSSVQLIETGDAEIMAELMGGFGVAILIGLARVYGVLVLLFHDFFQPLTILSAIPLSMGGAFIALLLSRGMLSLPSLIGLVMLMGIVTKNSILLVEYAVMGIKERGLSMTEALIDACHKRAPHHHDHGRDGGGHDAHRPRAGRRRQLPPADGDCRHRWFDHLHRTEPAGRARGLHLRGCAGAPGAGLVPPCARLGRPGAGRSSRHRSPRVAPGTSPATPCLGPWRSGSRAAARPGAQRSSAIGRCLQILQREDEQPPGRRSPLARSRGSRSHPQPAHQARETIRIRGLGAPPGPPRDRSPDLITLKATP